MSALFTSETSVVRKIWGRSDTILFIFAGAAAEFALNKAVDWLYFTGKLPSDPLGRLFTTVSYAKDIVFATTEKAHQAIDKISHIHQHVEQSRGYSIPDWAYRDVLFMLIHYSIAAYELLEKKLTKAEKDEVYDVFYRLGLRMQIPELPPNYAAWLPVRAAHLQQNLTYSHFTADLFKQYKKHLGHFRFRILLEGQKLIVPTIVKKLLHLNNKSLLRPAVPFYKISKTLQVDALIRHCLLPSAYRDKINALDRSPLQMSR
ncbi:oxygenase MpaB family protein [Niabella insulamsoli]|uniref:oxygenase MpaB family protein n=1 Tax=Niabella insulamsoli TaxID=3144874 RepID=UPI0031FDE2A6